MVTIVLMISCHSRNWSCLKKLKYNHNKYSTYTQHGWVLDNISNTRMCYQYINCWKRVIIVLILPCPLIVCLSMGVHFTNTDYLQSQHGKLLHPKWSVGWDYLSIPKLQWCKIWSLVMYKSFHPTFYWACNYVSMLGLKLLHVGKSGPWNVQYVNIGK